MDSITARDLTAEIRVKDGLEYLRAHTKALHARLDGTLSQLDLARRDDYARFLTAIHHGMEPVEIWLHEHLHMIGLHRPEQSRCELARRDLRELGMEAPPPLAAGWLPEQPDTAELWGALYVLEGSRMGAKVLVLRVESGLPRSYLSDRQGILPWQELQNHLRAMDAADYETMGAMASLVFQHFIHAVNEIR